MSILTLQCGKEGWAEKNQHYYLQDAPLPGVEDRKPQQALPWRIRDRPGWMKLIEEHSKGKGQVEVN